MSPVGIDCGCPSLRGLFLDLGEWVVALGFKNEISTIFFPNKSDDKIRLVIVRLAVAKIRDGEAKPCIFDKGIDAGVGIDQVGRRLLPLLLVCDGEIHVRADDLPHLAAGPEVNLRRFRSSEGFDQWSARRRSGQDRASLVVGGRNLCFVVVHIKALGWVAYIIQALAY